MRDNQEIELFNAQLKQMLEFKYTHHDLDFCNTKIPENYHIHLLQLLLNQLDGYSFLLKNYLKFLIVQLTKSPLYRPEQDHNGNSKSIPEVRLHIDSRVDLDAPDLAVQILKKAGKDFYLAQKLSIYIADDVQADVWYKLPRYLAVVLSLSLRKECQIYCNNNFNKVDCTPILMLQNLFLIGIKLPNSNFQYSFVPGVVHRLLRLNKNNGSTEIGTRQSEQKRVSCAQYNKDYVAIKNMKLESLNVIVKAPGDDNIGLRYFAHKVRMGVVAKEFKSNPNNAELNHFRLYLESALSLTKIARQIDPLIIDEIFNDAEIYEDLSIILTVLERNGAVIASYFDLSQRHGADRIFPHRTGWEALLINRCTRQLNGNENLLPQTLSLITLLANHRNYIELAAQLFNSSVDYLDKIKDINLQILITKHIFQYLSHQKALSRTSDLALKRMFMILLLWTQRCRESSFNLLRDYILELLRLGERSIDSAFLIKYCYQKSMEIVMKITVQSFH